ncbi:hypothetical protein C8R44DRAFT_987080 [Mycena epipterygia]|nr:hypothetical protein C8R44DRAFT_987080 [Mycena epipterygia]
MPPRPPAKRAEALLELLAVRARSNADIGDDLCASGLFDNVEGEQRVNLTTVPASSSSSSRPSLLLPPCRPSVIPSSPSVPPTPAVPLCLPVAAPPTSLSDNAVIASLSASVTTSLPSQLPLLPRVDVFRRAFSCPLPLISMLPPPSFPRVILFHAPAPHPPPPRWFRRRRSLCPCCPSFPYVPFPVTRFLRIHTPRLQAYICGFEPQNRTPIHLRSVPVSLAQYLAVRIPHMQEQRCWDAECVLGEPERDGDDALRTSSRAVQAMVQVAPVAWRVCPCLPPVRFCACGDSSSTR